MDEIQAWLKPIPGRDVEINGFRSDKAYFCSMISLFILCNINLAQNTTEWNASFRLHNFWGPCNYHEPVRIGIKDAVLLSVTWCRKTWKTALFGIWLRPRWVVSNCVRIKCSREKILFILQDIDLFDYYGPCWSCQRRNGMHHIAMSIVSLLLIEFNDRFVFGAVNFLNLNCRFGIFVLFRESGPFSIHLGKML